jgi:biopolymer transport protein ExbB
MSHTAGEDANMQAASAVLERKWSRSLAIGFCLVAALNWGLVPSAQAQDPPGENVVVEEDVALSFTLVAVLVMILITVRREVLIPTELVQGFEQHLDAKQFQEAYDLARNDGSFLGHVLSAGLSKVSSGYSEALEAMQEVGEDENMRLEHRLSYLALIATISPMIGLLGTVDGMIDSFKVIANTNSGAPDPQDLAVGVSTALFTTLVGLYLAIPALAAYNLLRNRLTRHVLELGIVSEGLMSRFQKKSV